MDVKSFHASVERGRRHSLSGTREVSFLCASQRIKRQRSISVYKNIFCAFNSKYHQPKMCHRASMSSNGSRSDLLPWKWHEGTSVEVDQLPSTSTKDSHPTYTILLHFFGFHGAHAGASTDFHASRTLAAKTCFHRRQNVLPRKFVHT